MLKLAARTVATLVLIGTPALAENQNWNVTEEGVSGVKTAQGAWAVKVDGDKISGSAEMQFDDGKPLTYSFDGSKSASDYTVSFKDRSDKKSACVWSGHVPANTDAKSLKLIGKVQCAGEAFVVRASKSE